MRIRAALGIGTVAVLAVTACGSSDSSSSSSGGGASAPGGASSSAAGPATGSPITIGYDGTFSGSQAGVIAVEKQIFGGLSAYISDANDHGGVNGRPVVVKTVDDAGDPNKALAGVKQLVEQDNVPAIAEVAGGPLAAATVPYMADHKIPLIGTAAPLLSFFQPTKPYVFGELTPYEIQAAVMGKFLIGKGLKNIAYAGFPDISGASYGFGLKQYAQANGGTIISEDTFARGATDFAGLASKLSGEKPDVVVFFASPQESAAVLKAAQGAGLQTTWAFGPGGTNASMFKLVGPLVENQYGDVPFESDNASTPEIQQYKDDLARYQKDVASGPYTQFGYLEGRVLVDALRGVQGQITADTILASLNSLKADYKMIAPFQLSPTNHVVNAGAQVVQFSNNQLTPIGKLETVDPTTIKPYSGS